MDEEKKTLSERPTILHYTYISYIVIYVLGMCVRSGQCNTNILVTARNRLQNGGQKRKKLLGFVSCRNCLRAQGEGQYTVAACAVVCSGLNKCM